MPRPIQDSRTPSAPALVHYDPLMTYARDLDDPVTHAFASAIELARSSSRLSGRPGFGLDSEEFRALLRRYFPGAESVYLSPACKAVRNREPARCSTSDEFDNLVTLLLEHKGDEQRETRWLAHAVAACCMGDDHLWQDMGLPNRQTLSDLLARHFPTLSARNTAGMRWKKFFYKQLCERERAFVCRSPSCAVCSDYLNCFGPEEDGAWR